MRSVLRRVGLVALLLLTACPPFTTEGYVLMNRRDHPLNVRLRFATGCDGEVDLADADNYGPVRPVTLDAQTFKAISNLMTPMERESGRTESGSHCGAVWLSVRGSEDVVLAWEREPVWASDSVPTQHALILEGPRDEVAMHLPDGLDAHPPPAR